MVINPFRPKPSTDVGEALLQTSATPLTIPQMLADSAARYGSKVAYQQKIEGRWERLSFEETRRQAKDFAAGLVALGLQKGDRAVIICENCLPWVVGYYGLSLAGGVGVPLYTELKHSEIDDLVKRSGARFVIASTRVLDRLGEHLAGVETVIVVGTT